MADIVHDLTINAPVSAVYEAVSSPKGLDAWWTRKASGVPDLGNTYVLWFGPEHDWRAEVSRCARNTVFELCLTAADDDWIGTRVGFALAEEEGKTTLRFSHAGWIARNEHFRISNFCWAMYLRLLKRYVEYDEVVPYERRLES